MPGPSDEYSAQHYGELCASVGNFFIVFARLEGTLASILKLHLAINLGDPLKETMRLSSAIYGSMRFKTARDNIKRIAKGEGAERNLYEFTLKMFAHLGEIEDFRDKIAHTQLIPAPDPTLGGQWQLTDAATTRDIKELKVYVFDTTSVDAAAYDLMIAANRIGQNFQNKHILSGLARDVSPIPWRYKSSMLKLVPLSKLRNAR